jgi:hypothetical protein
MQKLVERIAKTLFQRYAKGEGSQSRWEYLGEERQLAWMHDVLDLHEFYYKSLNLALPPLVNNRKPATSYEAGYYDGIKAERVAIVQLLEQIYKQLEAEVEDWKDNK